MGNIVVLDELTINKIAAGEVIERPSSVIKEMVENSIDAEAKNINVEIKNGGISYIKVTDDGKGIERDDLELSFERHATSKIRQADDLNEIKSMGFRGEALASIAAIAKVEMRTKTKDRDTGARIVVEGGNVIEVEEIGCPNGTSITVENLFYNTPVRYKFLKKDYTETGYIEDVITRLALIHPDISFKLVNAGKTIISTNGDGDIKNVIYSIYGKTVASACLNVNYEYEGINITGVVGKPEIARSNRANQMFFVNKRYIKDKILSNATEKAFKGMIPIGKFGFLILNIEMAPSAVDVNVHPAKLEVRFEEEQKVFKAVYYAIQDTLLKAELIANSETPITGKLEKEEVKEEPEQEPKQTKTTITDLFRRIKTTTNTEMPYAENNMIENIYNSKIGKENSNNMEDNEMQETNIQEPEKEDKEAQEVQEEVLADSLNLDNGKTVEEISKDLEDEKLRNIKLNAKKTLEDIQTSDSARLLEEALKSTDGKIELDKLYKAIGAKQNEEEVNNVEETKAESEEDAQNLVKEDQDDYETKVINLEEIEKLSQNVETEESENEETDAELSPGEILTDIVKKNANKNVDVNTNNIDDLNFAEKFNDMYAQIFGKDIEASKKELAEKEEQEAKEEKTNAKDIVNSNMSIFEEDEEYKDKIPYKFIGIAFDTYIILEIEKELYILDQHAAHERIMYEKVKKNYYSNEEKDSQLMLLPDIITLTHKEMEIARENWDKFEKAGFVLEEFGENTVKLTGVPNICLDLDTKELFLETLDEINTVARTAKQEIEERFIATIACKAAVKANMALTEEEVTSLLDQLLELKNPFTCPHGRPTAIKLSKEDIEKKFARRK